MTISKEARDCALAEVEAAPAGHNEYAYGYYVQKLLDQTRAQVWREAASMLTNIIGGTVNRNDVTI